MTDTPNEPAKAVDAWGLTNYAGELMPLAFWGETDAHFESVRRWPSDRGQSRVIPVTITPKGQTDE